MRPIVRSTLLARSVSLSLLASSAALLGGCIGIQTNAAREFATFSQEGRVAPPTALALSVTVDSHGTPANDSIRTGQDSTLRERMTSELEGTGVVKVAPNPGDAGYRLAIRVEDTGGGPWAKPAEIVSYMTLFVIPSWLKHDYATTAELTSPSGKLIGTRWHVHSLTVIRQLFLVLGMPSSSVEQAHARMWDAIGKDIAAWTAEQIDKAG